MSWQHAAQQQSNKTRPERSSYHDRRLGTLTSGAVLKKGPGRMAAVGFCAARLRGWMRP